MCVCDSVRSCKAKKKNRGYWKVRERKIGLRNEMGGAFFGGGIRANIIGEEGGADWFAHA